MMFLDEDKALKRFTSSGKAICQQLITIEAAVSRKDDNWGLTLMHNLFDSLHSRLLSVKQIYVDSVSHCHQADGITSRHFTKN